MKIKILIALFLSAVMFQLTATTVHAESSDPNSGTIEEYQYYLKYTMINPSGNAFYVYNEAEYTSKTLLCFVISGKEEQYDSHGEVTNVDKLFLLYYGGEDISSLSTVFSKYSTVYAKKDGGIISSNNGTTTEYANPYPFNNSDNVSGRGTGYYDLDTNIPIFRNFTDVEHYFLTGDSSGAVNKPLPTEKHDFTQDKYDPNIPFPELNRISYDGFSVTNTKDNEYFIDVVVESKFYGVKIKRGMVNAFVEPDLNWIFSSHYYNLVDSGKSSKMVKVNFPLQYGVSPRDDLIEDFKKWSIQYPSVNHLPGYGILIHPDDRLYKGIHVLKNGLTKEEEDDMLLMSSRAQVSYYVRFRDESGKCGSWVLYTFREDLNAKGGVVQVGQLETDKEGNYVTDSEGNPVVNDFLTGSQGTDGSDIDFSSGKDFNILEMIGLGKIVEFFEYIKDVIDGAASSLSSFGSLISACFGFLPDELIGFIVLGIVLMVFVGVIKAVI